MEWRCGTLIQIRPDGTVAVLHEILTAVLTPADAVSLHNHVHDFMVHQLSDIVDAYHRGDLHRTVRERQHIKIWGIHRRCRSFGFLYKLANRILETFKTVCLQTFDGTPLGIGVVLDHDRIRHFGKYTNCFCMRHVHCIDIL